MGSRHSTCGFGEEVEPFQETVPKSRATSDAGGGLEVQNPLAFNGFQRVRRLVPQMRSCSCASEPELETKMLPASSAVAQALCGNIKFNQYYIGKVPLNMARMMEAGRVICRVPGDAQHWAFVAAAQIPLQDLPTAFIVAQFGASPDGNAPCVIDIGLGFTELDCHIAIQKFVGSSGQVHKGSWTTLQGSPDLKDVCARASEWQDKQYNVWTDNCQHFARHMTRPYNILELTATSTRLNTEIDGLNKEVADIEKALADATKMREQQLKEFNAEQVDVLNSIELLAGAIETIGNHHGPQLLEISNRVQIVEILKHEMSANAAQYEGVISPSQKAQIQAFTQNKVMPGSSGSSHEPKSGAIFGILEQMKETFETNLAASQEMEEQNQRACEDMKAAKEAEIAAGKQQIDAKTQELASTDEKNAQAKEDLEDTRNTDEEFLFKERGIRQ